MKVLPWQREGSDLWTVIETSGKQITKTSAAETFCWQAPHLPPRRPSVQPHRRKRHRRSSRHRRRTRGPLSLRALSLSRFKFPTPCWRFADEIPDANWDYGTNLAYLKSLVDYWRDKYDWRAQERRLNQFDQFKTAIDGVDIHFIHQRSKQPNARPLLLLNGWPSSIVEYTKVIGPLTDPGNNGRAQDSFHLVIPSMPGYGFSGKPRERGYDTDRIGRM